MAYRVLADITLVVHLAFILFILFGGLLCLHRIFWIWLHLPAVAWGIVVEWAGWICPLTPLENHFRQQAHGAGYEGGFIEHYLVNLIYPANLSDSIQLLLGIIVLIVNLAVYLFVFYKIRKHTV